MTTKYFDNTRLSTHRECKRKYFFRHKLHFAPIQPSPALIFGACWHRGMDAVWQALHSDIYRDAPTEIIAGTGHAAFMDEWLHKFELPDYHMMDDDLQKAFSKRTPDIAESMLDAYVRERRGLIQSMELLQIEQPFAVPLDPYRDDLFYVGRLDKVVRWEGRVWVIEHKTSSMYRKAGGFAPEFLDSFSPNSQIDGYIHALTMLYGKEAKGILVDAALVHASDRKFRIIPVERQWQQIESWLYETHYETALIENGQMILEQTGEEMKDESFMYAFPKNTGNCFNFFSRCPYHQICRFVANPLSLNELPAGMKIEKWEPFKELNIDKLGMEDEDQ